MAEIEEKTSEEEQKAEPEPKGKSPKLIIIIMLAVVLAGGGFFGMKIMGANKKPEAPKVGTTLELEEFVVNLSDGRTWLKVNIALGLMEGAKKEEVEKKLPAIRDSIIMLLTSKKPKELAGVAGKEHLKAQLKKRLNALLNGDKQPNASGEVTDKNTDSPEKQSDSGKKKGKETKPGPVLEVYFTSFATQPT